MTRVFLTGRPSVNTTRYSLAYTERASVRRIVPVE